MRTTNRRSLSFGAKKKKLIKIENPVWRMDLNNNWLLSVNNKEVELKPFVEEDDEKEDNKY